MVARAFVYLSWCSFRNRLRVRLRRLKQPRYVIGLVFGLIYMWWFVFQPLFFRSSFGRSSPDANADAASIVTRYSGQILAIGSVVLFLFAALAWLWPGKRPALTFTRPEVQFLFQAPLTRRQLVHYRLIRSQAGTIFSSVIMTLLSRPGSLMSGWITTVGLWLVFSIISLHGIGVSLHHQSLRQAGRHGFRRLWLAWTLLGGSIVVLLVTNAMNATALASAATPRDALSEVYRLATTGAAGVVLWPYRAMLQVPLAPDAAAFLMALPFGLLILVANYIWVVRSDASFEEASAARAEEVATALAAIKEGRRLPKPDAKKKRRWFGRSTPSTITPFQLAPVGRPEVAIFWKNLIMTSRRFSLKTLLQISPFIIGVAIGAASSDNPSWPAITSVICMVLLGLTIMLGPQTARNDLRQDLSQLAVLKTWPISGQALLRGELAAPAIVLTSFAWLFTIVGAVMFMSIQSKGELRSLTMLDKASYGLAVMMVSPGLILGQLVIQNGLAIMFPAWVAAGSVHARGVEATGQRLLMLAANFITIVLSLLPGAIVGGLLALLIYWQTGVVVVLLPALILGLFMLAECWLAIEGLGRLLERTDVSAIDATE